MATSIPASGVEDTDLRNGAERSEAKRCEDVWIPSARQHLPAFALSWFPPVTVSTAPANPGRKPVGCAAPHNKMREEHRDSRGTTTRPSGLPPGASTPPRCLSTPRPPTGAPRHLHESGPATSANRVLLPLSSTRDRVFRRVLFLLQCSRRSVGTCK